MISVVIERCAGIDVGKKSLAVCVMTGPAAAEASADVRKFGTIRAELERVRECLKSEGCTHVVMESAGCYWKPVLNVLEDDPKYRIEVVLANAQQVKAVTGHKTDPQDARWLSAFMKGWDPAWPTKRDAPREPKRPSSASSGIIAAD